MRYFKLDEASLGAAVDALGQENWPLSVIQLEQLPAR